MSYREPLPEGCPPPGAAEVSAAREVFRLVRNRPPGDGDFRSQRAERPTASFIGVSECQARGLSVFGERRDCEKARMLPALKGRCVCRVRLESGAGRLQQTGRPSHHTWWPLAAFNILAHCEVLA